MSSKFLGSPNQTYNTSVGNFYTADAYGIVTIPTPTVRDIIDLINAGLISLGSIQARSNYTATTDPASSNDNTQDYNPGSHWVNTTNGRVWICQSAATGAAAWALAVVPGIGIEPASNLEQFGSGTGTVLAEGNIYRYASAGINPAGTAADYVLAAYSLPANSFDGIGNRGLTIQAFGSFANNTNAKRAKIIYGATTAVVGSAVTGGTTLGDTGAYSTTGAVGWNIGAQIFKYGAAGSNTQYGQATNIIIGGAHSGMGLPVALTATENAPILIAVTGNAATTATDLTLAMIEINALN